MPRFNAYFVSFETNVAKDNGAAPSPQGLLLPADGLFYYTKLGKTLHFIVSRGKLCHARLKTKAGKPVALKPLNDDTLAHLQRAWGTMAEARTRPTGKADHNVMIHIWDHPADAQQNTITQDAKRGQNAHAVQTLGALWQVANQGAFASGFTQAPISVAHCVDFLSRVGKPPKAHKIDGHDAPVGLLALDPPAIKTPAPSAAIRGLLALDF